MEWLKQLIEGALKGKVTDEGKIGELVTGIIDNAKKEIGKLFVPKDEFNSKNDELKAAKTQMDELQKQVKELGESAGATEEIKKKLKETEDAFTTFKVDTEKRETNRKKTVAIEAGLRAAKASDDAIDLLVNQFELDKITLDNKGNIVDWDDHLKPVKESRKTLFGEVKPAGSNPPNPPKPRDNGELDNLSDEEYYKKIGFPGTKKE